MKKWLLSLLLFVPQILHAQANVAGLLYASNFAQWTVPQGNQGQMSWSSPSFCTVTSGGATFRAFTVGVPITLVDSEVPANTETVTPTQANYSGFGCSISAATTHPHNSFYFRTATAGLGEALSFAGTATYQVLLTPDWTRLGGLISMITSATGNSSVTILDQRSSVIVPYIWGGSAYVAQPFGGGGTCGSNNIPCTNTANTYTGIQSAPGFAGTGTTQTVVNMTAGTAAATPPANSIQFGAPTSVPTSYNAYLPSTAPPDPTGDMVVWPQNGGTGIWAPPSGMTQIGATQTVSSSVATVSFISIPQTYKHLKLFIAGTVSSGTAEVVYLNFNTDTTTSNYFANYMTMSFSSTITGVGGFTSQGAAVGTANTTANAGYVEATIPGYTTTTTQKGYFAQSMGSNFFQGGGIWNSTAAITRIDVSLGGSGTWGSGTVMSLYGFN